MRRLNVPFKSNRKFKKLSVRVRDPKTGRIKTIHFGDTRYEDYTQHKDRMRRKSFRARHKCQTADDKTTARYWACKKLWN